DPDELCGFDLRQQAKSCGGYGDIEGLYYLVPGMCMNEGLKKVFTDDEVRRMGELTVNTRSPRNKESGPDSYSQMLKNSASVDPLKNDKQPNSNKPTPVHPSTFNDTLNHSPTTATLLNTQLETPLQTLSAQGTVAITSVLADYDWLDCRPESPILLKDLIGQDYSSDSDTDPEFDPSLEDLSTNEERKWDDYVVEEELNEEEEGSDIDDHAEDGGYGEPADTSDDEYHAVRDNVNDYNQQILELVEKLRQDAKSGRLGAQEVPKANKSIILQEERGNESYYLDFDAEKDTPPENFMEFRWQVRQRFTTRNDFREAVTKYGVYQGRNVSIVISDNARQQRKGVKCGEGCPFRLYASWESRRATYVVKTAVQEHTCGNGEKDFAYKVKYRANKLLHGSMKEHYSKVGRPRGRPKKNASTQPSRMEAVTDSQQHHATTTEPARLGKGGRVIKGKEGAEVVIQVGERAVVQLVIQVGEGALAQLQVVVAHGQGVVAVVVEEELLFLEDMESFMLQMGLPSP
ncbi:hypothetical protein RDABS01_026804, partial [Bienertia sinuspersici]